MGGDSPSDQANAFRARLLAVLAAIASSVGVVGFVAVVGGMVVWLRFDALHLPADTLVGAIPRTDLIVIGLSTLIPFIVLGLGAVFLAYIFAADNLVPSRPWEDLGSIWSGSGSSLEAAPIATTSAPPAPGSADQLQAPLAKISEETADAVATAQAAAKVGRPGVVTEQRARVLDLEDALEREFAWVDTVTPQFPTELQAFRPLREQTRAAVAEAQTQIMRASAVAEERQTRALVTRVGAMLGLVVLEILIVVVAGAPSPLQVGMLVVLAVVLSYGSFRLGSRTQGFAVFGAAIFLSVLLFGTATTLLRTYHAPRLQPVAILRAGKDQGLTGYFVAETSDRVYLVRIIGQRKTSQFQTSFPRLVVVPRSNIVAMEVGPFQSQETAYGTSYRQLQELCGQKILEDSARTTKQTAAVVHCGQQH